MTNPITASPLSWPAGWPRGDCMTVSPFEWHSIEACTRAILHELRLMNVHPEDVIISTDLKLRLDGLPYSKQRNPDDPSVAVYWRDSKGRDQVIALGKYSYIEVNLWAIGKTLEALRGVERWGGGQILDRAFTGFVALPSPETAGGVDPYQLIGITPEDNDDTRRQAYRKMLSKHHPDKGGDPVMFDSIRKAGAQIGVGR